MCDFLRNAPPTFLSSAGCVLELGSGLGCCGMLAAVLGASEVVLTDYHQSALDQLRANIARNQLQSVCSCLALDWNARVAVGVRRHRLIIGSDLAISERAAAALAATVLDLLTPRGIFLYACASPAPELSPPQAHRFRRLASAPHSLLPAHCFCTPPGMWSDEHSSWTGMAAFGARPKTAHWRAYLRPRSRSPRASCSPGPRRRSTAPCAACWRSYPRRRRGRTRRPGPWARRGGRRCRAAGCWS